MTQYRLALGANCKGVMRRIPARTAISVDPVAVRTVLGGQSLGALAALCAGLAHPQTFGLLLVQSGASWWEPSNQPSAEPNAIAREILNRPLADVYRSSPASRGLPF